MHCYIDSRYRMVYVVKYNKTLLDYISFLKNKNKNADSVLPSYDSSYTRFVHVICHAQPYQLRASHENVHNLFGYHCDYLLSQIEKDVF